MTTEQKARDRLAVDCTMMSERLDEVLAQNPGAVPKMAIVVTWPDGSGRLAAQWDMDEFLVDLRVVVGPDPRTDVDRMTDRIIAGLRDLG